MAEYLGVPVSTENDPEDTPSFHAVCKLWVKSDSWPIEDAVRLLLNHLPKVFIKGAEKENVHKSFKYLVLDFKCRKGISTPTTNQHKESHKTDKSFTRDFSITRKHFSEKTHIILLEL